MGSQTPFKLYFCRHILKQTGASKYLWSDTPANCMKMCFLLFPRRPLQLSLLVKSKRPRHLLLCLDLRRRGLGLGRLGLRGCCRVVCQTLHRQKQREASAVWHHRPQVAAERNRSNGTISVITSIGLTKNTSHVAPRT